MNMHLDVFFDSRRTHRSHGRWPRAWRSFTV